MISGSAIEFVEDVLAQLRNTEKAKGDLICTVRSVEQAKEDAEAKLAAAQDNLFSTQRKLYAACDMLNEVFRDYRDLKFKTKNGRKRADQMLDRIRRFVKECDIHIEQTEKGWVAK